jgi:homoserine kinase
MPETTVNIRVPATTANLGPAFDCLGLTLDLWNEARFTLSAEVLQIVVEGEGAERLPRNEKNLIIRAFRRTYQLAGKTPPAGLHLHAHNRIPLGSGLGSSAAAALCGILAANAFLGKPLAPDDILQLGAEIEGHADNLAAALYGGLVLVRNADDRFHAHRLEHSPLNAVLVLPDLHISTREARKALPGQVPLNAAVSNIAHSLLVAEAFRNGDVDLLATAMHDQLHQPVRLPLFLGAAEALEAAKAAGAAAALSGAGPGLIAFVEAGRQKPIAEALRAPFAALGISVRLYNFITTQQAAQFT